MALATTEGRQQILDALALATDALGSALAELGAAYEQLDQGSADRLEDMLFQPVQAAYGRAKRTHAGFADRTGLQGRAFEAQTAGLASLRAKGLVERAADAVSEADGTLAALQDSPLPVELGDVEVRAGLAEVRSLVGNYRHQVREFLRTLGR